MHPTRPILFSIDSFGDRFANMGIESMGTILMDSDAMQSLRERMPDSNIVISLPDALRNFVCYLDDEMMSVGADEKFRTKPEW
jgi:hypothetical protein